MGELLFDTMAFGLRSAPESFILTPFLFYIYMKQLDEVDKKIGLSCHQNVDDTQL